MNNLQLLSSHVTSTKNQWSRHCGFPPVFGKGVRVPGSVTSDPTIAVHAMALSNQPDKKRFRQDLAMRESARKAFAAVDNDQTLRRALVHRSRPTRGFYEKGEWVMMWKKRVKRWHMGRSTPSDYSGRPKCNLDRTEPQALPNCP